MLRTKDRGGLLALMLVPFVFVLGVGIKKRLLVPVIAAELLALTSSLALLSCGGGNSKGSGGGGSDYYITRSL